jgi:hypothetical protein
MMNEEIQYNHDRPLESFQKDLERIREAGFKPVAVTQMMLEETFVFETDEEATTAYKTLEEGRTGEERVVGWWYGREEFEQAVKDYENDTDGNVVRIYWL